MKHDEEFIYHALLKLPEMLQIFLTKTMAPTPEIILSEVVPDYADCEVRDER